ncbi:hypothetical protein PVAND_006615 [Polypedilum vanderplanki]|uniref:K Homology domain-containing protein n=1 Tax=Polypedilum vanderplanki TaxID=319348 RepID=A0A9J6C480_POLVA|nr:hypothetical protein PVAND_006615 [Polypedilum vanderplanki]
MKRESESEIQQQSDDMEENIQFDQNNKLESQEDHGASEHHETNLTTQDSSGPTNPPKRQRRNDDEEIRLLIPSKLAGAIIGKGGHNIQKLRTEYKAQVNVGDCQGPERVITIGSSLDTCCLIIREIMKHFDKGSAEEYELCVLIHQSLAGCVIGKSGSKIKELKDKIGCRLKIFSNIAPQSTDRIAQIIGKEEQCIECLTEIMDLIKTTPIKGPVHNYDPHNFDDIYADEYGGYGSGLSSGNNNSFRNDHGGRARYNDRQSGGSRFSDRRGANGNGIGSISGGNRGNIRDYVDPWAHNMNGNNNQMSGSTFGNLNMGNNSGNPNNGNSFGNNMEIDGKQSTQVTIPKDLAGAIIGKGGGRIRRIRSESNAFIQIDEALPGSTDRIITITGTPKQIQAAQYMLQQSIRNGSK